MKDTIFSQELILDFRQNRNLTFFHTHTPRTKAHPIVFNVDIYTSNIETFNVRRYVVYESHCWIEIVIGYKWPRGEWERETRKQAHRSTTKYYNKCRNSNPIRISELQLKVWVNIVAMWHRNLVTPQYYTAPLKYSLFTQLHNPICICYINPRKMPSY